MRDAAREAALWAAYKADPSVANRNALVEHYMPEANAAARKVVIRTRGRAEHGDVLSGAVLGLMDAVGRFDPGRGLEFTAFAWPRVIGGALDELRRQDANKRLYRRRRRARDEAERQLYAQHGRNPNEDELRTLMGLTEKQWAEGNGYAGGRTKPIERTTGDGRRAQRGGVHIDPEPDDSIDAACRGLAFRDRVIVRMYVGDGRNMKDTGRALGISESRVSQEFNRIRRVLRLRPSMRRLLKEAA